MQPLNLRLRSGLMASRVHSMAVACCYFQVSCASGVLISGLLRALLGRACCFVEQCLCFFSADSVSASLCGSCSSYPAGGAFGVMSSTIATKFVSLRQCAVGWWSEQTMSCCQDCPHDLTAVICSTSRFDPVGAQ
jgi:hypothetical protein